ncbi:hypothetical protein BOX15_Mlig018307g1, partial [Macrostomum lignano]
HKIGLEMPTATSHVANEDSRCQLQLEVHWPELRRFLPNILSYNEDLQKCIVQSDLNELSLIFEVLIPDNSAQNLEQIYGLNDLVFEKLRESRLEKKYFHFCELLERQRFTEAVALLKRRRSESERRLLDCLAEHYRHCLLGSDGKSGENDSLVNDLLLTTLCDFNALTENDVEDVRKSERKMPALLSVLMKHEEWPAKFLTAIVYSEGNCHHLERLLPGFEEYLVQGQRCSLADLQRRLDETGAERDRAEQIVRTAFDSFIRANAYAFEELPSEFAETTREDPAAKAAAASGGGDNGPQLPVGAASQEEAEVEEAERSSRQQMRAYQLELAEAGLAGRNCMVVAPTGSGKTLVGIEIAARRLAEDPDGAKVAFLADRTQLVDQQYAAFKNGLPEPHRSRVICVRGGSVEQFPLSYSLRDHSVLVLSTQILLNNLLDESEDGLAGDVAKFSLLIFDECHHCDKDHPSKKIMDLYFQYRDSNPGKRLPQIVGLTASPGTGQACKLQEATEHVLKICANLDCQELCTVRQHLPSLRTSVFDPKDRMHWAPAKPFTDSLLGELDRLMQRAEDLLAHEAKRFEFLIPRPPSARGSFIYTNYTGMLHKMLKEETREQPSCMLHAAWKHLLRYNFAHLICSLFRSVDALRYLRDELDPKCGQPTCRLDRDLRDDLRSALPKMDAFCREQPEAAGSSPALKILAEILRGQFGQNGDSRVIIFVQQRCFTRSIKDFLDSSQPELANAGVRAAVMTGANACGAVGGITQNAQTDTLADFRRGVAKILISTSVSEEGLDVQKCNMVVRFCHVTNEIAMVQSKGRGRAEGSTYHVIVPEQLGWLSDKEKTNRMRDEMMQEAVLRLSKMEQLEFQAKVQKLQSDQACLRKIQQIQKSAASARGAAAPRGSTPRPHYNLQCVGCNTLACTSLDLRMADKHFVVLRDSLLTDGRARLQPRPGGPAEDLLNSQIVCAKCQKLWGGLRKFKDLVFPWLKVEPFKFVNSSTGVSAFGVKKWADTSKYFGTPELSNKEMLDKAEGLPEELYMQLLAGSAPEE